MVALGWCLPCWIPCQQRLSAGTARAPFNVFLFLLSPNRKGKPAIHHSSGHAIWRDWTLLLWATLKQARLATEDSEGYTSGTTPDMIN
jgi:hypothetical protein